MSSLEKYNNRMHKCNCRLMGYLDEKITIRISRFMWFMMRLFFVLGMFNGTMWWINHFFGIDK